MKGAPAIAELRIAADPDRWSEAGFEVAGELTRIGSTLLQLAGRETGRGLTGWSLTGAGSSQWDGLPTEPAPLRVLRGSAGHPNGARSIDHVVVFTPALERTIATFEGNGVECKRIREVGPLEQPLRQAFFRFGEVICEVVQVPADQAAAEGAARFWGLTVTVADLDRAVAELGPERCGTIRDAVQPGRRIATVRREAALGLPVALISPEPERSVPTAGG